MDGIEIQRHRAAITRGTLSKPVRLALEDGILKQGLSFFDFGCGHGEDVIATRELGIKSSGWDPYFFPDRQKSPADVVNLGYVVNVIENPVERAAALRQAWDLAGRVLVVAARLDSERVNTRLSSYQDGYVTSRGTFQKFYEQAELRDWIAEHLETGPVSAAPGIFYVFRDDLAKQSFVASRYSRRIVAPRVCNSDRIFEQYKAQFEAILAFFGFHGRLPEPEETPELRRDLEGVGSARRILAVLSHAVGTEPLEKLRNDRKQDLLVYLALAKFEKRLPIHRLPPAMQLDIKSLFGTYKEACQEADTLLFSVGDIKRIDQACRSSRVGKLTAEALYIHTSALSHLSPELRIYEGCARVLVGRVEGANLLKLNRLEPKVSYLAYPEFETDPHPALSESLRVHLQSFNLKHRSFADSANPPILHRKETFLAADHPLQAKFARLTAQEERHGLYAEPTRIGTRDGWDRVLEANGVKLSGHRVVKATRSSLQAPDVSLEPPG